MKIGENVDKELNFQLNDKVFGFAGFPDNPCCYSEYLCTLPTDIADMPKNLSFEEAAALPTPALTALQSLKMANIHIGSNICILGGAGGVGHLCIQLAKNMFGAIVTSTASKRNHEFITQLGADKCIDYSVSEPFKESEGSFDAVIDNVGGDSGIQAIQTVKRTGLFITVPTITAEEVKSAAQAMGIQAEGMLKKNDKGDLIKIAELCEANQLKVEIMRKFSMEEVVDAHKLLETGHIKGKCVLTMNNE